MSSKEILPLYMLSEGVRQAHKLQQVRTVTIVIFQETGILGLALLFLAVLW
jgi:hypothetical protein